MYQAGQSPKGNVSCQPIRLGSEQDSGGNSDNQIARVATTGNQHTVSLIDQQTHPRQIPQPPERTDLPEKSLPSGHRGRHALEQLSGRQPECRRAVSHPGHPVCSWSSPEDKPVGQLALYDTHRHESDSGYEQIRQCLLVMGLVYELKDEENSAGNESVARQDHRLVKGLKDYFKSSRFDEGAVYKVRFTVDDSNTKINLAFTPSTPVTLATPQPEERNVFASAFSFSGGEKLFSDSPDAIFIEIDDLNNDKLFEAMINKIRSLEQVSGDDSELKLFVHFRRHLPLDQGVLSYPGYRLITGAEDPAKAYVSDTLRISGEKEEALYIEFKIPLIELISVDLDSIINKSREYPSTLKKFHKNNDLTGSINNRKNWDNIHSKTTTIVRNYDQAAPEKNALTGDYLGSGIAQKVSEHGAYPSTVLKFLPKPMDSVVEATIVINTLNVMQTLIKRVIESVVPRKNNTLQICFSPVYYLMVVDQEIVDQQVVEDKEGDLPSDGLNDLHDKPGPHLLQLPGLSKRFHSHSESEQFHEMVNIPVESGFTLEDELNGSPVSELPPGEGIQCQEAECVHPSFHPIHKMGKVIWIAGMQRKYEKSQMVEYILQDPNECSSIKIEIVKGILNAIDIFENFNKEIEVSGGSQIKCIIDANFGNFAFDRVGHRLIYLDVAPATSSLNGQVVPGNQFMVDWVTSRQKFVYKLSTDPQMTKLFLLVMVTNELRKLEEQSRLYKDLNVRDENLDRRVTELDHVVGMISNQLVETDNFMRWCDSSLLDFLTAPVKSDMFDGDLRNEFHSKALNCFQRYMDNKPCCYRPGLMTKDLSVSDAIRLLRILTDVAAEFLAGVKKEAKDLTRNGVKKIELISTGVINKKILGDFEVVNLIKDMAGCRVQCFLSGSVSKNDGFYDVVLKWLNFYSFNNADLLKTDCWGKCGLSLSKVKTLKEYITGDGFGVAGDCDSKDTKRVVSLPLFLKKMSDVLSKKIDLLLIEPFSGDQKKVRIVQYMWGIASDSSHEIVLKEYSGVKALQNLMGEAKPETLILVNHQVNNRYSMGDVGDFHWSSACLGESRPKQSLKFNPALPLKYKQENTGVYEKIVFEKIVQALKMLYTTRDLKAGSGQGKSNITDETFLARIIPWIPESCAEWRAEGGGKEYALIKMNLSSSNMFRFNPLLRGYSDMIHSERGQDDGSRIYMIMCFPEAGRYVRWMLRVVTRDDQELSYMNFRGPFSLADLKQDIDRSLQGGASQLDFMFIDGGYGYSSGHFYLHKVPGITVQSGYSDEFFGQIEKSHPKGPADQDADGKDFHDGNDDRDDTDNLTSLELQQRLYKLDSP